MKYVPKDLGHKADVSRGNRQPLDYLKLAVGVVVLLLGLYFAIGLLARGLAKTIPDHWEAKFGSKFELPKEDSPEYAHYQRVKAMLDKLQDSTELRKLPDPIIIIDEEMPNAFAVPGGEP